MAPVYLVFLWFVIVVGIFCGLELLVRLYYPFQKIELHGTYSQVFNMPDAEYGYKPSPNVVVSVIKEGLPELVNSR